MTISKIPRFQDFVKQQPGHCPTAVHSLEDFDNRKVEKGGVVISDIVVIHAGIFRVLCPTSMTI